MAARIDKRTLLSVLLPLSLLLPRLLDDYLSLTLLSVMSGLLWAATGTLACLLHREKHQKIDQELSEVESHPLYPRFLEANPNNRYIYKEETKAKFTQWLSERGS